LLVRFPLADWLTFDYFPLRRQASQHLGAVISLDPSRENIIAEARQTLKMEGIEDGVDLAFEISGSPLALNQAIGLTAYNGRIIVGSWYGSKQVALDLGGRFHRSRIRLIGSQVSSLAPQYSGRWDKMRRFGTAWEMIRRVNPSQWITQRVPFEQASQAYSLLDESPGETIQVVLNY
jgi:threonine dehydrogenase-like Zn-dependent dehydrogenase